MNTGTLYRRSRAPSAPVRPERPVRPETMCALAPMCGLLTCKKKFKKLVAFLFGMCYTIGVLSVNSVWSCAVSITRIMRKTKGIEQMLENLCQEAASCSPKRKGCDMKKLCDAARAAYIRYLNFRDSKRVSKEAVYARYEYFRGLIDALRIAFRFRAFCCPIERTVVFVSIEKE